MEKEILSPHQAWQEVKKIQRFLAALDQTEETLKVLAEYDSIKAKLMAEIPMLEKQAVSINEAMVASEKKMEEMKAVHEKVKMDIVAAHKASEAKLAEMKADADKQLEAMKSDARRYVENTRSEVEKLQPEVMKLKSEKKELEMAIENLKKQASEQVNSLVGAFKNLGQ